MSAELKPKDHCIPPSSAEGSRLNTDNLLKLVCGGSVIQLFGNPNINDFSNIKSMPDPANEGRLEFSRKDSYHRNEFTDELLTTYFTNTGDWFLMRKIVTVVSNDDINSGIMIPLKAGGWWHKDYYTLGMRKPK